MICNVLGTAYTVEYLDYKADPLFEQKGIIGYQNALDKRLVVCRMASHPEYADESEANRRQTERETLRHEIVHAFLCESGLADSAASSLGPWPKNEEMVDWIALQGPKMLRAFEETGCL